MPFLPPNQQCQSTEGLNVPALMMEKRQKRRITDQCCMLSIIYAVDVTSKMSTNCVSIRYVVYFVVKIIDLDISAALLHFHCGCVGITRCRF